MEDEYNSIIELEDFCLISFLTVSGFPIESINSQKYPQLIFLFKRTKKLNEAMNNFYNNTSLVEPKLFFAKMRELKARIKSIKN